MSEGIMDRAIRLEAAAGGHQHSTGALAVPQPFGRDAQKGGLVIAELVYAAGVAFVLAGIAAVAGPGKRWPRRPLPFLLGAVATLAFASLVLPAVTYPPLPPGAETARAIGDRQLLYLGLLALGAATGAAAGWVWAREGLRPRVKALATAALAAAALLVAAFGFPGDPLLEPYPDPALLDRFRAAAIGSQALFWSVLGAAAWLLARRLAPPRSTG